MIKLEWQAWNVTFEVWAELDLSDSMQPLTLQQFSSWFVDHTTFTDEQIASMFVRMDTNNDNSVSPVEWYAQLVQEWSN